MSGRLQIAAIFKKEFTELQKSKQTSIAVNHGRVGGGTARDIPASLIISPDSPVQGTSVSVTVTRSIGDPLTTIVKFYDDMGQQISSNNTVTFDANETMKTVLVEGVTGNPVGSEIYVVRDGVTLATFTIANAISNGAEIPPATTQNALANVCIFPKRVAPNVRNEVTPTKEIPWIYITLEEPVKGSQPIKVEVRYSCFIPPPVFKPITLTYDVHPGSQGLSFPVARIVYEKLNNVDYLKGVKIKVVASLEDDKDYKIVTMMRVQYKPATT